MSEPRQTSSVAENFEREIEKAERRINNFAKSVFLPPLIPAVIFMFSITYGGLTNTGGGHFYMPVLMEIWFFAIGFLAWGAVHLVALPLTMLLTRWFHGLVTGLCYALLIAVVASIFVVEMEWLGATTAYDWQRGDRWRFDIATLVFAPVLLTMSVAFVVFVRRQGELLLKQLRPFSSAVARNLFMSVYLLWLSFGAYTMFDRTMHEIEIETSIMLAWVVLPWLLAAIIDRAGYWRAES